MPRKRKTPPLLNPEPVRADREIIELDGIQRYKGNPIIMSVLAQNAMGRPVSFNRLFQTYIDGGFSREDFSEFCQLAGLPIERYNSLLPADGSRPTRHECPSCHMIGGEPSKKDPTLCTHCDGSPKE